MKLREIIRPPINEDIIPARAKQWWAKYGKTVSKGLLGINIAMAIHDVHELLASINRLPKDMTEENRTASIMNEVGKMVATYGLPECMFLIGAVIGGGLTLATGPGFVAGAGIGGLMGMFASIPASFAFGDDIESLVAWLVKKYYLGDTTRSIRLPDNPAPSEPYKPDPKQQAYRRAQTGMDTPGNPDPRKHPERYPKP